MKVYDVAIIGGGIAGLSAAWYVQQGGTSDYVVLERSGHWGGKIITQTVEGYGDRPFVIEGGPDTILTRKPEVWELAYDLGIGDQIIPASSETAGIYVLDNGRPVAIPMGPLAFIRSPLLSWRGKLRMLVEPFIPARRDDEDESLGDFASRRLGREALDKFIGPVLGGIYNTDPEKQSIMTTSPVMREMEREYGGLFKGAFARMRQARRDRHNGTVRKPRFITFQDGVQTLIDALVERLSGDLKLQAGVEAIERDADGYRLTLADGSTLAARRLIIATPANVAARLLQGAAPDAARLLAEIPHVHLGTISLAFNASDIDNALNLRGLMIPRREGRRIDAVTWTSAKSGGYAPAGHELIRVFFGGADPQTAELDDASLQAVVLAELHALLGIEAEPVAAWAFRWRDSYPQARVGHLALVDGIETALPDGIVVTGSSYRGLGVPDCVRQGKQAAEITVRRATAAAGVPQSP